MRMLPTCLAKGTGDMMAYQNGTLNVFKVAKVYYHPGVMRVSQGVILRNYKYEHR